MRKAKKSAAKIPVYHPTLTVEVKPKGSAGRYFPLNIPDACTLTGDPLDIDVTCMSSTSPLSSVPGPGRFKNCELIFTTEPDELFKQYPLLLSLFSAKKKRDLLVRFRAHGVMASPILTSITRLDRSLRIDPDRKVMVLGLKLKGKF